MIDRIVRKKLFNKGKSMEIGRKPNYSLWESFVRVGVILSKIFEIKYKLFKGLPHNFGKRDLFILVLITYPESFMMIGQKCRRRSGFPVRFSGQAIETCVRNTITLQH